MNGFRELYVTELQEAQSFEAILAGALPKLAKAASEDALKQALLDHQETTKEQQRQVEAILTRLGADPSRHKDQSMERLVEQAEKMAELTEPGAVRDAGIIAAAQRIEHYEIAVYGTLSTYARMLGFDEDHQILGGILEEEKETDDLLSNVAEGVVNPTALEVEAGG